MSKEKAYKETEFKGTAHVVCVTKTEDTTLMYVLHNFLKKADADWPFIVEENDGNGPNVDSPTICLKCGGLEYLNPQIGPLDIKALFKQFNIQPIEFSMKAETDCKYDWKKEEDYGYRVRPAV